MYSLALKSIFGIENLIDDEIRLSIVKQMSDLAMSEDVVTSELEIVQTLFEELSGDTCLPIRVEIAKTISHIYYFSRHLVLKMAEDSAPVAQYILCYSQHLSAIDLVEYANANNVDKQLAIANRRDLPNEVVAALIEHGTDSVVLDIIKNTTANLTADNLRQIYINFNQQDEIRGLLFDRADLPADLRELITFDMSKQLESYVVDSKWLDEKQASNLAQKTYEIAVVDISDTLSDEQMALYIRGLSDEDRLTPSLILRSVTTGYMRFFEHALSYLAGLPIQKLHSLLHNPSATARNALFNRSKLPVDLYPILTLSLDVYKQMKLETMGEQKTTQYEFSVQMIKNVTEFYHTQGQDSQAYLQRVLDCYYIDASQKIAA